MIYVCGVFGFISGFLIGQMVLAFMLRHRSREDLLNDRYLKWTYGLMNWVFAAGGAYAFVLMYNEIMSAY